ncbi:GbsR/MarR family transcriptional regulator [Vacuolonema iberomarrocanum]|uniref:GbsR/MarR family transcriptional regulator n=1 Tax=Vacuolonema iberomarrocanum TaxID=3454632 RepID=UPI0019E64211|nr:MarR family transcriptional regulator [filamentous cyanobacterium LEGE 07170]
MITEQTEFIESALQSVKECNDRHEGVQLKREQPSEQAQFLEEMGLMFENVGMPRMAGRVFGWLLISNPPLQSSGELVDVLQASKGSISTMTRLLIQIGLIERVSLAGDRRDYFQIKPNAWTQLTQQQMVRVTAFRKLAERGLELLTDSDVELQQRLQEMWKIHAFWERELPQIHQRWEQEQMM